MMIIDGSAYENAPGYDYRLDFYENGKTKIKEFPNLHKILGEFSKYNEGSYANNAFLNLASKSVSDAFNNDRPNKNAETQLLNYEELVGQLNLYSYPREKRKSIFAKMSSFNREQNNSIVQEFDFYVDLRKFSQITDIVYDNFVQSNHDFRFAIDEEEFNVELTHIGKNEFDDTAKKAFEEVAQQLISTIPSGNAIIIHVSTEKLLKNGRMDKQYTIDLLIDSIKKIMPIIMIKKNNSFFLDSFGESDKNLFENKELFKYYDEFGERLNALLSTKEGTEYLKSTKIGDINRTCIKSVTNTEEKGKAIVIQSECCYPSIAESLREICVLGQLKRAITEKINKNQLAGQKNPIIALQLSDAILFEEYARDNSSDSKMMTKLKGAIQEPIVESTNTQILGVILYEKTLDNSVFICNPNINIPHEISDKLESLSNLKLQNKIEGADRDSNSG